MSILPSSATAQPLSFHTSSIVGRRSRPTLKLELPSPALISPQFKPPFEEKNFFVIHPVVLPEHEDWMFQSLANVQKNLTYQGKGSSDSFVLAINELSLAIIKPAYEYATCCQAEMNPIIFDGIPIETVIYREALAYQLFSRIVPATAVVRLYSEKFFRGEKTKTASMQKFIMNGFTASQLSFHEMKESTHVLFSTMMIDMFLYNLDRNEQNILFRRSEGKIFEAIPIDHGCVLPNNCSSGARFFWLSLIDKTTRFQDTQLQIIQELDISESVKKIQGIGLTGGAVNTFLISTLLVKHLALDSSILDIAMYQLEHSQYFATKKSILHYLLNWALFREQKMINPADNDSEIVSRTTIESLLVETIEFIKSLQKEGLLFCQMHGISDDSLYTTEEDFDPHSPAQKMHIAYLSVRTAFFLSFLDPSKERLESGGWRKLAQDQLQKFLRSLI